MYVNHDTGRLAIRTIIPVLLLVMVGFSASILWPFLVWIFIPLTAFFAAYLIVRFRWETIMMKALAFMLPFSVELPFIAESMLRVPTEPFIALAAMVLVLHLMRNRAVWIRHPIKEFLWAVPLILIFAITTVFSPMRLVSVKFAFVNIIYLSVFYFLLILLSKESPRLFPRMLFLYGLGFLLVTAWSFYQFWQWEWNPLVVRGIFQPFYKDHTLFGASAAVLAAFWATGSALEKSARWKLLSWTLAGFFFAGVLLSGSRAALLSLFVAGGVWLLFFFKPQARHVLLFSIVLLIAGWTVRGYLTERIQQTDALSYDREAGIVDRTRSVGNISTDVSNLERLNRWTAALRMFKEKPLTGFGPGTYQFQYITYQDPALMNRLSVTNPWNVPEGSGGTAHSEYLLSLSEMGVFGLLSWLLLMGRWTWLYVNRWRSHPNRQYMMVAFIALTTYFFHALVNNFLTTDKFAFLFWGTAAWLVANYHASSFPEKKSLSEADFIKPG